MLLLHHFDHLAAKVFAKERASKYHTFLQGSGFELGRFGFDHDTLLIDLMDGGRVDDIEPLVKTEQFDLLGFTLDDFKNLHNALKIVLGVLWLFALFDIKTRQREPRDVA